MQTDNKSLLSELAYALTDHSTFEIGSRHFIDLTEGGLFFYSGRVHERRHNFRETCKIS